MTKEEQNHVIASTIIRKLGGITALGTLGNIQFLSIDKGIVLKIHRGAAYACYMKILEKSEEVYRVEVFLVQDGYLLDGHYYPDTSKLVNSYACVKGNELGSVFKRELGICMSKGC